MTQESLILLVHNKYIILSTSYCEVIHEKGIEVESSIQGHYTYGLTYPNQNTPGIKKVVAKNLKQAF